MLKEEEGEEDEAVIGTRLRMRWRREKKRASEIRMARERITCAEDGTSVYVRLGGVLDVGGGAYQEGGQETRHGAARDAEGAARCWTG